MFWRIALLVATVTVVALAGSALYLHQVDRYPLRAVPTFNPRRHATRQPISSRRSCAASGTPKSTHGRFESR
jgi:hypothetical protein